MLSTMISCLTKLYHILKVIFSSAEFSAGAFLIVICLSSGVCRVSVVVRQLFIQITSSPTVFS